MIMDLVRRHDWPDQLNHAITLHRDGAFQWGQYDCATFFSDCVFAITDGDPLADLWPWRSERDALRLLAKTGCGSVREFLNRRLPIVGALTARRGDAGYQANSDRLTCPAIIIGAEAISRTESGWVTVPITTLTTVYRIG